MKILLSILLGLFITNTWAASFYCPNNHRFINAGDKITQVMAACGEPTSREEDKRAATSRQPLHQYFYQRNGLTLNMTIAQNRVVRISVGGEPVGSTSLCADFDQIKLGDTIDKLILTCGEPTAVNTTEAEVPTGQSKIIEAWTYQFNPYHPPVKLIFTGGVLTDIQQ